MISIFIYGRHESDRNSLSIAYFLQRQSHEDQQLSALIRKGISIYLF